MKYKKEKEEVISKEIGHPYNIIPKGYPNEITNKKIKETISKILDNTRGNFGVESIVNKNTSIINLGIAELTSRQNKKQNIINIIINTISLIFVISAFIISVISLNR